MFHLCLAKLPPSESPLENQELILDSFMAKCSPAVMGLYVADADVGVVPGKGLMMAESLGTEKKIAEKRALSDEVEALPENFALRR